MKKVCIYPFRESHYFSLLLPIEAEILGVQVRKNQAQILALVNPGQSTQSRYFYVARTDEKIPHNQSESMTYIGTFELTWIDDGKGDYTKYLFEVSGQ